jgi:hypothetical protein
MRSITFRTLPVQMHTGWSLGCSKHTVWRKSLPSSTPALPMSRLLRGSYAIYQHSESERKPTHVQCFRLIYTQSAMWSRFDAGDGSIHMSMG